VEPHQETHIAEKYTYVLYIALQLGRTLVHDELLDADAALHHRGHDVHLKNFLLEDLEGYENRQDLHRDYEVLSIQRGCGLFYGLRVLEFLLDVGVLLIDILE
jgi:hypothetical protein